MEDNKVRQQAALKGTTSATAHRVAEPATYAHGVTPAARGSRSGRLRGTGMGRNQTGRGTRQHDMHVPDLDAAAAAAATIAVAAGATEDTGRQAPAALAAA